MKRQVLLQATAGVPPEAIYFVFGLVAGSVSSGFFNALGTDLYNALKNMILTRFFGGERKEKTLVMTFKEEGTELSFHCTTDDPEVIQSALDGMPEIMGSANQVQAHEYYFDNESKRWEE